jgi:hypothetical protein
VPKTMRCEIIISRADRRAQRALSGKVAVGLLTLETLGHEAATWYLISHGVALETILRVMTLPRKRRR